MWPKINKDFLPMKGHYFLFNAGTAPVQPFMPVYAKQLGFSSVVVGTIYSILPVTGMIAKPLFGAIADRYKKHKLLFLAFQILTIMCFFSIQFVPEVPQESQSKTNMSCDKEYSYFKACWENDRENCAEKLVLDEASSSKIMKCSMKCDITPSLRPELCGDYWKMPSQICVNPTVPSTTNSIGVPVSKGSDLDSGKPIYSEKYSFAPEAKLEFDAIVRLNHTLEETNCMYFRIEKLEFADNIPRKPFCVKQAQTTCETVCDDPAVRRLVTKNIDSSVDVTSLYQYWLFFLLLIGSWIGQAVVVAVSDAICFEILGERASQYGNQRLWGSVGWGIFAVIAGLIVDEISRDEEKKIYTPLFYMMLVLLSADVICSYHLRYQQTKMSSSIVRDVGRLLLNVRVVIFMLWCIFIGMCMGLQWNFLYWHLEELASKQGCESEKWIKTLEGLVSGVQCFIGELPSFFISGYILRKLGHIHCMSIVLFLFGLRFLLYSALVDPWWCLPIEILQASFGLFYPIMVSYASIVAPPGTEATVQGLVGGAFEGIGVGLGSLTAGFFFNSYGGSTCFRIFGIASMVLLVVHGALQFFLNRSAPNLRLEGKVQASGTEVDVLPPQPKESTDDEGVTSDSSMETIY